MIIKIIIIFKYRLFIPKVNLSAAVNGDKIQIEGGHITNST